MSLNTSLAFFGLFMAVMELYIPNLSLGLERLLSRLQEKLVAAATKLKNAPTAVHTWVMGSRVGKFYSKYWKAMLLLGFLPGGVAMFFDEGMGGMLLGFGLIPILLLLAYSYLLDYIWWATWLLRAPCFVIDKSLRILNFIGKGKALSGIGLVMAFWGLFEPVARSYSWIG